MVVISLRKLTPTVGKTALLIERAHTLGGIYARHGARVRIARVIGGEGAGQVHIYNSYDSHTAMMQASSAAETDPALTKLMAEREHDPAGVLLGPEGFRSIYGEPALGYSVMLQREYSITRENLPHAVALLPQIEALFKKHDAKLAGFVPTFSADMGRMIAAYYFHSRGDMGAAIDSVGMSKEFQSMVDRANTFGRLTCSRFLTKI